MLTPDLHIALNAVSFTSVLEAAVIFFAFIAFLFVGSIFVPGPCIDGPDCDGKLRDYKINGLALFVITVSVALGAQVLNLFSLSVLVTHFFALFIVANIFAFSLSGWLYYRSVNSAKASPAFLRGYFFGVGSNPNWYGVDLKFFSYRPSLIGLALLNLSFAALQYETYGELSLAMMLYEVFTFAYILNYFHFEQGMAHTWDMVSERFGWMLIWGDYVLVPFFYSLAGWWLVHAPQPLSLTAAVLIGVLFVLGFWIFRGANGQKHRFKRNPDTTIWGRPAQTLEGRLLISGFWGIGRHLNYSGEICIYFAFVLTTGFESWIPFLLPLWLICLLTHRSRRDEIRCRKKYGELWMRYKQKVRYSMLPYVY